MMDHKKDSYHHPSKKKCNRNACQKSKGWYVHTTLMPTRNDVINQQDIHCFTCKTCQNNIIEKINSCTIGNVSIRAMLHENTFSRTYAEEATTREHHVGSNVENAALGVSGLQEQMVTMMQQQKLQQQQQQQQYQEHMRMMMTQMMNMNM